MRRLFGVIGFIITVNLAFGAKIDKGFEALQMFNYFEAKKIFEKSLKKKPVPAAYGLSKVYDAEKSPFFNIDSANKFVNLCDSLFLLSSDKDREKLKEFGIDENSILKEKVFISAFFFIRATEENTLQSYQKFISDHAHSSDYEEALKLRNHAAYLIAVDSNSIDAWNYFLNQYPNSGDYNSAKKQLQILEYQEMTLLGDAQSFKEFAEKYPNNPYAKDAQEMVYQLYIQDGKIESYETFIKENPNNKNVKKAWSTIYKMRTSEFSPAQIFEFMIDFPLYPFKEDLRNDLELSMTTFYPAKKEGLWGFIDTTGNWLINPQYSWVSNFSEGKASVGFMGKSVFIDKHGKLIFKHLFDDVFSFSNHLAVVSVSEQYGVINYLGDIIIPLVYDEMGEFSENLIYASKDNLYGYFNSEGDSAIPFIYETAFDFHHTKAIIKSDSGYGVINDSGNVLVEPIYESVLIDSSLCIAKTKEYTGVLNFSGDTIVPFTFDLIGKFSNNRAIAVKDQYFVYLNRLGEQVIKEEFGYNDFTLSYSQFNKGYAKVIVKEKVGIIDTLGNRVYPAIFTDVGSFNKELTAVRKGNLWGYANSDVKLVIPYTYNQAYDFHHGYAIVKKDSAFGVINQNNEVVIPFGYDKISVLDSVYLLVEKNGLKGVLNYQDSTIVPVYFTNIDWIDNDVIMLENGEGVKLFSIEKRGYFYKEEY